VLVAAALMGGLLWWVEASFAQFLLEGTLLVRLVSVLVTIIAAVIVYFGFAFLTGGLDRAEFARLLKRRKKA
jgi:putative peptidoglycan lipid II flippase